MAIDTLHPIEDRYEKAFLAVAAVKMLDRDTTSPFFVTIR